MKKYLTIGIVLTILAGGVILLWKVQAEKAKVAKYETETIKELTVEDIALVLKSEAFANPQSITDFQNNAEKRQAFLKGLREYFALAAQARQEGFTENADYQLNVEYKKDIMIADLYRTKLSGGSSVLYVVPEEEVKKVLDNSENLAEMEKLFKLMREIQQASFKASGNENPVSELSGRSAEKARNNWAKTKILSDRAKADNEFMQRSDIQLRLKIVEAGILAADYLRKHQAESITATDEDIAEYLKAHPEYSIANQRKKAEQVLQRVKNGEDFAVLAKEFSEDRPTKEAGGLYKDLETDTLWAEVEQATLKLEKGQIADSLIETNIGFHIVKLEDKKIEKEKDGKETVKLSVRHILFQNRFEEPNINNSEIPPPFMKAEEIAKAEVEKTKREKFVSEIIRKNPISLPADFTVELPKADKPSS